MACGMYEAHINKSVRNAFQVKNSKFAYKEADYFYAEKDIPKQELKKMVAKAGYNVVLIRQIFSLFSGCAGLFW